MFTEVLFDDSVVLDWDSLALDLGEASFVEQLLDRLQVGFAKGNAVLNETKHLQGGFRRSDKGHGVNLFEREVEPTFDCALIIVPTYLQQSQQSKDGSLLGRKLADTLDSTIAARSVNT